MNLTDDDRECLRDIVDSYKEKAATLHYAGMKCADMSRDELLCLVASLADRYMSVLMNRDTPTAKGER